MTVVSPTIALGTTLVMLGPAAAAIPPVTRLVGHG